MATMYRLLTPEDLESATAQIVAWHAADRRPASGRVIESGLRPLLEDSRVGHCWMVEIGNRPVGYLVLGFSRGAGGEPRAHVSGLYFEPAMRGQGHGPRAARFLQEVGKWLRTPIQRFDANVEQRHSGVFSRSVTEPAHVSLRISA